jgi:hypothetical protein
MSIKRFTIYGERCSGTNFLEQAIKENFNLELAWNFGWKHFFGFSNFENSDDVLFIGIIRDPYKWINSLYVSPHHLQNELRKNTNNFLTKEFWSYDDNKGVLVGEKQENAEIMQDRNMHTKERYKNIFECRKVKIDYLVNCMPKNVKNYILVRYEDLCDNFVKTINLIKEKFNLSYKHDHIKKITKDAKFLGTYDKNKKKNVIEKGTIDKYLNFDKILEIELQYINASKD